MGIRLHHITLIAAIGIAIGIAGCSERADPVAVSTHADGFADPNSDVFHGQFALEAGSKNENCTTCHGEDYTGGTAGVSCFQCHAVYPHPENFKFPSQENFHGKTVAQVAHYDLSECQGCHGEDYAGNGFEVKNCLTCHTKPDGPEDCQTCHGSQATNAGPPRGLMRTTDTALPGIGAHQYHLADSTISTIYRLECSNCHITPETYDAPGHIDDFPPRAEVVFGPLATHDGRLNPVYDFGANTCGSTYCHGGFVYKLSESENPRGYADSTIEGNNLTMSWTEISQGPALCTSCHSIPPTGHIEAEPNECWRCHSAVVDADLNIIDPSLHVNGEPNVFGNDARLFIKSQ
ncbi:cytochrome c3 family protein [Bacteroidota bacterium]